MQPAGFPGEGLLGFLHSRFQYGGSRGKRHVVQTLREAVPVLIGDFARPVERGIARSVAGFAIVNESLRDLRTPRSGAPEQR